VILTFTIFFNVMIATRTIIEKVQVDNSMFRQAPFSAVIAIVTLAAGIGMFSGRASRISQGSCKGYTSLDVRLGQTVLRIPPDYNPKIGSYSPRDVQADARASMPGSNRSRLCAKDKRKPVDVRHLWLIVPSGTADFSNQFPIVLNMPTDPDGEENRHRSHDVPSLSAKMLDQVSVDCFPRRKGLDPEHCEISNIILAGVGMRAVIPFSDYRRMGRTSATFRIVRIVHQLSSAR
jgi:hypothetical protein